MTVLVGSNAFHDLAARGVVELLAGVVVRNPGRQFLQRDVDETMQQTRGTRNLTAFDLRHARPLQRDRVERASDRDVIAQHDRMPALFRGPAPHPDSPGAFVAVQRHQRVRVVGQVVLGEEIHEQRAAHAYAELDLMGVPRVPGRVIAPAAPRHKLVGEPFLGAGHVAVQRLFNRRLELGDESGCVHAPTLPTSR